MRKCVQFEVNPMDEEEPTTEPMEIVPFNPPKDNSSMTFINCMIKSMAFMICLPRSKTVTIIRMTDWVVF